MVRKKFTVVGNEPSRVEEYVQEAANAEALRFTEMCDTLRRQCESPIEELLVSALYSYSLVCPEPQISFHSGEMPDEPAFDEAAFVYQQVKIGPYRADFAIWDATLPFNHTPPRIMIVECDGHDFHERTKEQARRDKQRDRFFVSKGHKVLRFTGSEIWANPDDIADEVINELARNDSWRNRAR
jgi:very-short-patch-repair endonuclease